MMAACMERMMCEMNCMKMMMDRMYDMNMDMNQMHARMLWNDDGYDEHDEQNDSKRIMGKTPKEGLGPPLGSFL